MAINPLDVLAHLGKLSELVRLQQVEVTELHKEIIRLRNLVPEKDRYPSGQIEPDLGTRLQNFLMQNEMSPPLLYIDEIVGKGLGWWMRQPTIGQKSLRELQCWLSFHGRNLSTKQHISE